MTEAHTVLRGEEAGDSSRPSFAPERSLDVLYATDAQGRLTYVSPSVEEVLGYKPAEVVGRLYSDLIAPGRRAWARRAYTLQMARRVPHTILELPILTGDGEVRWVEQAVTLVVDHQGRATGFQGVVRDITDRRRREHQLRKLAREREVLASIGRIMSSSLDIGQVYRQFASEVRKLLPFDRIAVALIDRERRAMVNSYVEGTPIPGWEEGTAHPIRGTVLETVVKTRQALIEEAPSAEAFISRYPGQRDSAMAGLRAMIVAPLVYHDRVIGVLGLRSLRPGTYRQEHLPLITEIANQISGAVANAQLHESLRQEARDRAILAAIGRVISSSLDVDRVFDRFTEEVRRLMPAERITIDIIHTGNDHLTVAYSWGLEVESRRPGDSLPLEGSLVGEVVRGGKPVLVQGPEVDRALKRYPKLRPAVERGFRSFLSAPLLARGRVLGVLNVRSRRQAAYTRRHVVLARQVADQIAGAISNAWLYRDLRQAQKDLQDSEARFRELFDEAPVGYHEVDTEGRIVRVNRTEELLLGYSTQELLGKQIWDLMPPDERESARERFFQRVEGDRSWSVPFERTLLRKDGRRITVLASHRPLFDKDGGFRGSRVTMQDITELKRVRAALERVSQRNRLLLESVAEGIVGLDGEGRITFLNASGARLLGWPADRLKGAYFHEVAHRFHADGSTYPADRCPILQVLRSRETVRREDEYFLRRDGRAFPVEYTATPVWEEGRVTGAVVAFQDITQRRRAQEELRRYAEELARSNEDLQQFAYVASHDLQEPLRMVASYTQLLARRYKDKLDAEAQEFIAFAVDGANRMQRLIQDLLEYSRVQSKGREPEPTEAQEALQEALANLSLSIQETGAQVTWDSLPRVKADASQLTQLFQNLIGNAVKFRGEEAPRIHVSARREGERWVFSVRDNGIGIDPKYARRIFAIFQRLHGRNEYPGTGIGLAVCKRIVDRHGGQIWVESTPGQGSTFYFTMPPVENDDGGTHDP